MTAAELGYRNGSFSTLLTSRGGWTQLTFARSVGNEDTLRGVLITFLEQPTYQSSYSSPCELRLM